MTLKQMVVSALERVAQSGLSLRELTIVLPLREDDAARRREQLKGRLAALDALTPSPGEKVEGLHAVRWMLLHSAGNSAFPGPLLGSLVFEGDVDNVLFALVERFGPHLDGLLEHCVGAPVADAQACVSYLKAHRLQSGYLFSDHRTRTLSEIVGAVKVKRAFETFYAENQTRSMGEIREKFAEFRAGGRDGAEHPEVGQTHALSRPFERRREQEEAWTRRAVELTVRLQDRDAREARRGTPSARKLRVAHAKHHGCVRATFVVDPKLDVRYQHGVLQPGKKFRALLRFSNTSNRVRPDYEPDGRGVALKLLDVGDQEEPLVPGIPDGVADAGTTQDFLMISSPNFFAKDIRDFTIFRSILDTGTALERVPRLLAFFSTRPRELGVLTRTMLRPVSHPLDVVYHSVTASLLGPHLAVKHSLRLKPGQPLRAEGRDWGDPHFLRTALQKTLHPASGRAVELEFSLHVPGDHPLSVEDSSLNWEKHGVTRVPVATVVIEPQDFTSPALLEECEGLVFTPWHSLAAHKPLGSLNRARLAIYRASSKGRAKPEPVAVAPMRPAVAAAEASAPSSSGSTEAPPAEKPAA